jgi:hypothetical protein
MRRVEDVVAEPERARHVRAEHVCDPEQLSPRSRGRARPKPTARLGRYQHPLSRQDGIRSSFGPFFNQLRVGTEGAISSGLNNWGAGCNAW